MDTRNADLLKLFGHYDTIRVWLEDRGHLRRFHPTLLGWAISQFQWIQKRIPREAGGALFDVMAGIVGPVDQVVFDQALRDKRFRIQKQMRTLRAGNREAFLKNFDRQFTSGSRATTAALRTIEKPLSLGRLFLGHVKANGWRPTMAKAVRHIRAERLPNGVLRRRNAALTEETMLKYMALLQRDMDRKHAEQLKRLTAVEDALRETRATRGGE